jgi:hypothetical protein
VTLFGSGQSGTETGNQRGSVLLTVLAVIFILLTMFLSVLTYALVRHSYHVKERNRAIASRLAESGINRCLYDLRQQPWSQVDRFAAAPNGGSIKISVQPWGPYLLVFSDGRYANQTIRSSAVVGSSPPALFNAAISTCNTDYPLVVTGNTRIIGDVNTGPSGMTEGRMAGVTVAEENYHVGVVHSSETIRMPVMDSSVLKRYRTDMSDRRDRADRTYSGSRTLAAKDTGRIVLGGSVSIEDNLLINGMSLASTDSISSVFVGGRVEVAGDSRLGGLIELVADGPIILKDSAVVDGALFYSADSILITGTAVFSGVAVSTRKIVVEGSAAVLYPSALYLDARHGQCDGDCGVFLSSRGLLETNCIAASEGGNAKQDDYLLQVDTVVRFSGFLLSNASADIRGAISGSIVTDRFHFHAPPSTYVNWVRDLYVNRSALGFTPALPVLSESSGGNRFRTLRSSTSR